MNEVKFKIGDQWVYRGNQSPAWIYLASKADGSPSGIAEVAPESSWWLLEHIAATRRQAEQWEYVGGGYFREKGIPKGEVAKVIHSPALLAEILK